MKMLVMLTGAGQSAPERHFMSMMCVALCAALCKVSCELSSSSALLGNAQAVAACTTNCYTSVLVVVDSQIGSCCSCAGVASTVLCTVLAAEQ